MHVKLNSHRKNLDTNEKGHHITRNKMVNEHWVPLLTDKAKEDWIKTPKREMPLRPQLEQTYGDRQMHVENMRGWDSQHLVGRNHRIV
jgi:hypothetical protein